MPNTVLSLLRVFLCRMKFEHRFHDDAMWCRFSLEQNSNQRKAAYETAITQDHGVWRRVLRARGAGPNFSGSTGRNARRTSKPTEHQIRDFARPNHRYQQLSLWRDGPDAPRIAGEQDDRGRREKHTGGELGQD